ncbi:3,4-dihydroxyphenylacetate 2,3-dioxygenase [Alloalcanivorax xenomutans]|jgi:3,4-dihydroxyphenylacetate 2,3-dioxygenase|uniref:3,4-dihydroxyphenylacetate 2,3-dioxygenase n=1 Tax=Alloalcanivorax xenomutans TaxID=1094342 RepID=A0A9Q3ZH90_9GAMM|nr:3,4-dihydroxyphenylacetate 2,3-dioxygenase [Alloalcanivorax xenomutans]KYZ87501.1 3,4-dihydroxyphenylacetate 2,3-dioxygenase [Alcanivorax sp. KX64203]MBA4721160.1 3,4-dihydroxyphenylacetate 2,3-dioxygenase [Alcanivorax sp.]ARB46627.1 3,4-dihydroxyphenylacetate 2,3-dioxygenase [Alloalcanivorax xenomutans]MCE7510569.1 3,4-dihydroxyphenylacetate 2,3-dioxygenase [Alloalcanivorax xenomutans]MCE7522535.1 3,4-dihydroxyphenylacetate 2,3-dioxygenase [Alloalcanivorax xenomutans]
MGEVVLAAKITHVPSMYLSELPGKHQGCRQAAIDGHKEIGRRARELGADTAVVFDVHWLVNSGFHINCGERFEGIYTSNELPHFIKDMRYRYGGNPALGENIAAEANAAGVRTLAHNIPSLELEYGTLVPMRYMHMDVPEEQHLSVISIAAWNAWHRLEDSFTFGAAVRRAIEASDHKVLVLASGSLSHRFSDDREAENNLHKWTREFDRQVDMRVVDLWRQGRFGEFCAMLPDYAEHCYGEGGMHDTAMLLGLLGGAEYDKPVEILTEPFGSSGTGQINAVFPLPW